MSSTWILIFFLSGSFIDNSNCAIYHFHFHKLFGLLKHDTLVKKPNDTKSIEDFILIKNYFSYDVCEVS